MLRVQRIGHVAERRAQEQREQARARGARADEQTPAAALLPAVAVRVGRAVLQAALVSARQVANARALGAAAERVDEAARAALEHSLQRREATTYFVLYESSRTSLALGTRQMVL